MIERGRGKRLGGEHDHEDRPELQDEIDVETHRHPPWSKSRSGRPRKGCQSQERTELGKRTEELVVELSRVDGAKEMELIDKRD